MNDSSLVQWKVYLAATNMRIYGLLVAGTITSLTCKAQFGELVDLHANAIHGWVNGVEAGDLDNDGRVDLFVTLDTAIGYALGQPDGSFSELEIIAGSSGIFEQGLLADVNSDGNLDVVYAQRGLDSTWIFLRQSTGGLGYAPEQVLVGSKGSVRRSEMDDLDGDGDPDLALTYSFNGIQGVESHAVWFRNEGGGTWSAAIAIHGRVGIYLDLALIDVDGDAQRDVVVCGEDSWVVSRSDGMGGITGPVNYGTEGVMYKQSLGADLDGDGDIDLLAQHSDGIEILWNDGAGAFNHATTEPEVMFAEGSTLALAVDDLDLDGDIDLIASDRWFANNGSGDLQEVNGIWPLTPLAQNTWYGYGPRDALVLLDLDGDGDRDLIMAGQRSHRMFLFTNAGQGPIGPPVDMQPRIAFDVGPLLDADVDGDGVMDALVGTSDGVRWFRALPTGGFAEPQVICHAPGGVSPFIVRDFDQDGDPDLVYWDQYIGHIMYVRNVGAGAFDLPEPITSLYLAPPEAGIYLEAADLDGDGDQDLLEYHFPGPVQWYANDGAGQFGDVVDLPFLTYLSDILALVDMNNDGAADLICRVPNVGTGFPLYLSDGTGSHVAADPIPVGQAFGARNALPTDLDSDGDVDLIFVSGNSPCLVSWIRDEGMGEWSSPILIHSAPTVHEITGLKLQDVDGDGLADLLFVEERNENEDCGIKYKQRIGPTTFGAAQVIYTHDHSVPDDTHHINDVYVAPAFNPLPPYDVVLRLNQRALWTGNFTGTSYEVNGRVFHDTNANGAYDPGEAPMPFVFVQFAPQGAGALTFENGQYTLLADAGTYTLNASSILDPALWTPTTPAEQSVTLTPQDPVVADLDFGYAAAVDTSIVHVEMMTPIAPCGGAGAFWLHLNNQGTRIEQGTIQVSFDPQLTFLAETFSPEPTNVTDTTLTWELPPLSYWEHFSIQGTVMLPDVSAMGDELNIRGEVFLNDPSGGVGDTLTVMPPWILSCAYDPNDKSVAPVGYGDAGAVAHTTEKLYYTIRFQNTGTAAAQDVVLHDALAAQIDLASVELVAFSHQPTSVVIDVEGALTISFTDIMLPDSGSNMAASQGYVTFGVRLNDGLPHLTEISNTAEILFDLNPPIITNTTLTTLVDCDLWEPTVEYLHPDTLQCTEGDAYQWNMNGEPLIGATARRLAPDHPGTYSATVTSGFGCTALSEPFIYTSLDASVDLSTAFRVNPNPFRTTTTLRAPRPLAADDRLVLYDPLGRVVSSFSGNGTITVDLYLQGFAPGLYLLRVTSTTEGHLASLSLVLE